jgi:hypothetical protein
MRHRPKTLRLPDRPGKEGDVVAPLPGGERPIQGGPLSLATRGDPGPACDHAYSRGRAVVYLICSMAKLELTSDSSILPISFL